MPFARIRLIPSTWRSADPSFPEWPFWRLEIDGELAAGTLFGLNHGDDPMQVAQCGECGVAWCADGGCVAARAIGEAIVWGRPAATIGARVKEARWPMRFQPLPLVASEPVWFAESEYRRFRPLMTPNPVRPADAIDCDHLLRAALVPWTGTRRGEVLSWEESRELSLYRGAEPENHPSAADLIAMADHIERTPTTFELVAPEPPDSIACRLVECWDAVGFPMSERLAISEVDGERSYWHCVGRGCWAKLRTTPRTTL